MLRNKPRLEGPVIPLVGAVIGGMAMGGGTIATMSAVGMALGSAVGGLIGGMTTDKPSYPTMQAPGTPAPPTVPAVPALKDATATGGEGSPSTTTDIAKGETEAAKRRGRLSTILTARNQPAGGDAIETLG